MKLFLLIMMLKCRQIKFLRCDLLPMLPSAKVKQFHPIQDLLKLGVQKIPVEILFFFGIGKSDRFLLGAERWPSNCSLRFVNGDRLQDRDEIYVGSLSPGEQTNISVDITSPTVSRIVRSQWRLFTSTGVPFGGRRNRKLQNQSKLLIFIQILFG